MQLPVYLYGMISASSVYKINEQFCYPEANGYAEVEKIIPSVGGEAVNSAIILAKLGIHCTLDGCWINTDDANQIGQILKPFSIDTSLLTIKNNVGCHEIVIADGDSRTVFGNYSHFHNGKKQWNSPNGQVIQESSMVGLDPYFKEDALLAAQLCVKHQRAYVTLDCCFDDYIAQNAAAIIISHELRNQTYSGQDRMEVFQQYLNHCIGLVIFTFGSEELWYARKDQGVHKFNPFKINPVDTTGAGDAFRGAIIYGLLQKWTDEKIIEFASAVAACVCLTIPHTLNAPNLDGVLEFIKKQSL